MLGMGKSCYNHFMNDNFKCFYKILRELEKSLDKTEVDQDKISSEALGISKIRWCKYMEMLLDCGYIKNIEVRCYDDDCDVIDNGICITLSGLEYLSENTIMQRIYEGALKAKNLIK